MRNRIAGQALAEDVVDGTTGEILAEAGTVVSKELADDIQNAAVPYVWIQTEERKVKVLVQHDGRYSRSMWTQIRRRWGLQN